MEPLRQPRTSATPSPGIRENASDRIPKFLLPVLRANLASGGEIRRSVAVLAAWARTAEGDDDAGLPLSLVDPRAAELGARADRQRDEPLAFLDDPDVFGDLAADPRFAEAYRATLTSLRDRGARATVAGLVSPPRRGAARA